MRTNISIKTFLIVMVMAVMPSPSLYAQGIEFEKSNWDGVVQKAKAQNKLIFLDVFTSWCGPCKKMAREAFPDKEVGTFFNTHFINYGIDAEKGEGVDIARKYAVTAFPTCLFINGEGEVVYRFMAAKNAKQLLQEGEKAEKLKDRLPQLKEMQAKYAAGDRSKGFLKDYCALTLELGMEPGTMITEYFSLLTDDELFADENLNTFEKVAVYDKKLIDRMGNYYKQLPDDKKEKYEMPVMKAIGGCLTTILMGKQADRADDYEHLLDVKESMNIEQNPGKLLFGGGLAYYNSDQLRMSFYEETGNDSKYMEVADRYLQKNVDLERADTLYQATLNMRKDDRRQYDELVKANDTEGLKKLKSSIGMRGFFISLSISTDASFLMSIANHYWDISDKGTTMKQKLYECAKMGFGLNPSMSTAVKYANFLQKIGYTDEAKTILEREIADAKENPFPDESTEADMQKAEEKLKEL